MRFPSMRPNPTDYLPLTQFPFTSPAKATEHTTAYCLRRRVILVALFTTLLLALFAYLKHTLGDIDDDDFDDLDFETLSSLHTSYLPFQVYPSHPDPTATALNPVFTPYHAFQVFPQASSSSPTPLKPMHTLPDSCLDAYFARGELCYAAQTPKLDFLWTWVNGSDPLLQQSKKAARQHFSPTDPFRPTTSTTEERLYRDHDELRHSLRSVLANFRAHIGRFFLLTSDFSIPETTPNLTFSAAWRIGQIPQWLDLTKQSQSGWLDENVELDIIHHAEVFHPYNGMSFNSLAIESQLGHVQGISDYFIYMNDDLYMATTMMPASFFTSAYGIVLHLQPDLMVSPQRPTAKTQGEWRGMGESNYMLSARFGRRFRPYVMHEAKIVSAAILAELETVWPDAFKRSASHPFRETAGPGVPADINTLLLHAHFIVERAREALLWSWVVGRVGAVDNAWGSGEARRAWEELGGVWETEGAPREVYVRSTARGTLERQRVLETLHQSGQPEGLGKTSYVFSSLDGYPYSTLGTGASGFPPLTPDVLEESLPQCKIKYDECFAGHEHASDVFRNIAFQIPRCGDCVISALMRASGSLGNSAFLPPPDRTLSSLAGKLPSHAALTDIPHLPLVDKWEDGDFSLREVMGITRGRNVREWTIQLLQRYRYVIGSTPAMFERLLSPQQAISMLGRVDRNTELTLLCVNDDVTSGDDEVTEIFRDWQERHWGTPAAWEKQ